MRSRTGCRQQLWPRPEAEVEMPPLCNSDATAAVSRIAAARVPLSSGSTETLVRPLRKPLRLSEGRSLRSKGGFYKTLLHNPSEPLHRVPFQHPAPYSQVGPLFL